MAALGAMLAAVAVIAAACHSGGSSSASTGSAVVARIGNLEIIHPFLPDPASPAVAAVYLTVRNEGSQPDRLVSVSTPAATSASLMTENPNGTMSALPDLPIPAHGEASLTPGVDHMMLENPNRSVALGQAITVTLRFARAGVITIEVPVVPLSEITNDGGMTGMG